MNAGFLLHLANTSLLHRLPLFDKPSGKSIFAFEGIILAANQDHRAVLEDNAIDSQGRTIFIEFHNLLPVSMNFGYGTSRVQKKWGQAPPITQ